MASFPSVTMTTEGLNMIAKASSGNSEDRLIVTKVKFGDGVSEGNIREYTDVINPKMEVTLAEWENRGDGRFRYTFTYNNKGIKTGFYHREIGLFAKSGNDGGEKLIAYSNAGSYPGYIDDETKEIPYQRLMINIGVGDTNNVTGQVDVSNAVTIEMLDEHDADENAHEKLIKKLFGSSEATLESVKEKVNDWAKEVCLPLSGGEMTGDITANNVYANNNVLVFNNVTEMKASNKVKEGYTLKTLGFYITDDGGGANYFVTDNIGEDEVDEASVITLQKGLYAKLLIQTYINAKWFGAKGDGITDDTTNINKITTFLLKNITKYNVYGNTYSVIFPKGIYKINSTIKLLYSCTNWYFQGAVINATEITGDAVLIINTSGIQGELNYSINGLRLVGNINNTNGVQFGEDNENDMHAIIFKNVSVRECKTALNFDKSNNYIITFYDTALDRCETCFNFSSGSNSGEKITFINSSLGNSDIAVISANGTSDLYFINCSFDYNKVCYIARGGSINYLIDCHIEWTNKEQEHFQVYGASSLNIRGGYLLCQGTDNYTMPICKIDRDSGVGLTIDGTFVHGLKAPALANSGAIVRTSNINGFKYGDFPFKTPDFYQFNREDTSLPLFIEINNDYTIKDGYVSITKTNNLTVRFISKVKNKNNFKQTHSVKATSELPSSCHVWSSSSFVVKLQDGSYKQLYLQGTGDIRDSINANIGNYYKDTSYLWRELKVEEENWGEIYAMQSIWFYGIPDDTTEICLKDLKIEGW